MTILGLYFTVSLVTYLAYATPTIVLVYYLYPTRTLIRVPFIIGVIFYTIALQSLILYLLELLHHSLTQCSHKDSNNSSKVDQESEILLNEFNTSTNPSYKAVEDNSKTLEDNSKSELLLCCECCWWDQHHIEEQHQRNNEYYAKKLEEDLNIVSQRCHVAIATIRLVAGIIILIAFICGVIVATYLVFRHKSDTDINSLLALLPTVVFSVFAWFGRGLIFDVREDIKELSIPYFKKKPSTEEKILKAINELVQLQKSIVKQESQNHTTAHAGTQSGVDTDTVL